MNTSLQNEAHQPLLIDNTVSQNTSAITTINKSDWQLFWKYSQTTLTLTLMMDNEWGLVLLGLGITWLNHVTAAPLITSLLGIAYYTNFSIFYPIMADLSKMSGKLACEQEDKKNLTEKINLIPRHGLIIAVVGWGIIIPILCFSGFFLQQLKQNAEVAKTTQQALRYFAPFFLFFSPRLLSEFFLVCFGQQTSAMKLATLSLAFATLLGSLFVFIAHLSLSGLMVACGTGVMLTAISFGLLCKKNLTQFDLFSSLCSPPNTEDIQEALSLLRRALPIVLVSISDVAMSFVLAILAGQLGQTQLKIQNGATQFLTFNYLLLASATQTMTISVSGCNEQLIPHKEKFTELKRIMRMVILSTLALQAPLAMFVIACPSEFALLAGSKTDARLRLFFTLNAGYALLNSISFNLLQALRNLDDLWASSAGVFLLSIVGTALAYTLSQHAKLDIMGLPLGIGISTGLNIIFLLHRFSLVSKRTERHIHENNASYVAQSITYHAASFPAASNYKNDEEPQLRPILDCLA